MILMLRLQLHIGKPEIIQLVFEQGSIMHRRSSALLSGIWSGLYVHMYSSIENRTSTCQ